MEKGYTATIGLEIHAHLKTKTKMFSRALNNPDEAQPNVNISPIDVAHPGTLPVINKKALEHMVRVGLAVGGTVADFTEFDRKNYFYPDIPKGYQISQFKYPVVSGGSVAGFDLTRIHLEEDTATSKHLDDHSLVDFNRAGSPLMELVTEPVLHTPEDVMNFARELQLLLRYLGASDANIEKGQMRVEVNLSVSKTEELGTKVEVKNIGSITAASKATAFEIKRQIEVLESGGELFQETRGWDDAKEITFSQRSKEDAKDYRYFPEPDLPKLYLHDIFDLDAMREALPELPQQKRERYETEYGIKSEDIETYIQDQELAAFFEAAVAAISDKTSISKISNYLTSDVAGIAKGDAYKDTSVFEHMSPESFAKMIDMLVAGDLSSRAAKDILLEMIENGGDPKQIADDKGLIQENDTEALKAMAQTIIDENPGPVAQYHDGKESMINFFVGQGMKASKGAGNPQVFTQLFSQMLGRN